MLNTLPHELLELILSYLCQDDKISLLKTCSSMRIVCSRDRCWKSLKIGMNH